MDVKIVPVSQERKKKMGKDNNNTVDGGNRFANSVDENDDFDNLSDEESTDVETMTDNVKCGKKSISFKEVLRDYAMPIGFCVLTGTMTVLVGRQIYHDCKQSRMLKANVKNMDTVIIKQQVLPTKEEPKK